MLTLGIETSCDDTCLSVINDKFEIVLEYKINQDSIHKIYGGVVPELASRSHLEYMQIILKDLENKINPQDIKCVASTTHPGLSGSLLIGYMTGYGIANACNATFIPINHLDGHIESVNIGRAYHVKYPMLILLISGGHCQFMLAKNIQEYEVIGKTLDDSVGEALDKIGKMLNLEYPGGPKIEAFARHGKTILPIGKPMYCDNANFSFSGFKTSALRYLDKNVEAKNEHLFISNICKSVEEIVSDNLSYKTNIAIMQTLAKLPELKNFVLCGGVSANILINSKIANTCQKYNLQMHSPNIKYATDNATMIAFAGLKRFQSIQENVK